MTNAELMRRDLAVLWHPCTQMKDHESRPVIPIRRGQGIWLEDFDGRRYLDAISSWWVNLFGHANPYINTALREQLDTLEQVLLAGYTHEPVVELSERLLQLAPPGLARCFYADSGSASVEIALKMSYHYWRNLGKHRKTKFITLTNSYHGETLGALAVGNVPLYKSIYAPLLMDTISVPSPDCFFRESGESCANYAARMFSHMEAALEAHAANVCAIIVEPLVQCAGNMRMYDPLYLRLLRDACDRHGVHLIADEVAVGFGRTGTMFACETAPADPGKSQAPGITPDFLCLGKGLTGGYLPLSVTLTTKTVYEAFYGNYQDQCAFLHSHSYTGNPLACRAALATLDIFSKDAVLENNLRLAQVMADATRHFAEHPHIAEVRQQGMILAIELVEDKTGKKAFAWQDRYGLAVCEMVLRQGILLRPLGDVIYFMPPYVIEADEIRMLAEKTWQAIDAVTNR